jgi:polyhydroxyalkanoate synthesis repressor PhaR
VRGVGCDMRRQTEAGRHGLFLQLRSWLDSSHLLNYGAMKGSSIQERMMPSSDQPIIIKKYANRRLYNTGSSTYVTLDDLAVMVKAGDEFVVQDAKTGEDITRSVLAQIIFDQEAREGQNLLPITFLRQLIQFYGDSMQAMVPTYLEHSMASFAKEQEKFREQMSQAFGGMGIPSIEEQVRRNMEMFQKAAGMFMPFGAPGAGQAGAPKSPAATEKSGQQEIQSLKEQLAEMQKKIDKLG